MSWDLSILNGDLVINDGDLDIVQGSDKLSQDILKICLTPVGANIYQPWYGSTINQSLVGSAIDSSVTTSMAQSQLQSSIDNLKKLQQLQMTQSLQSVTPDEQIAAVKSVQISQDPSDSRRYNVSVKVISRAFRPTTVNFEA